VLLFMFGFLLFIYFAIWCTFVIFFILCYPLLYIVKCRYGQIIDVLREPYLGAIQLKSSSKITRVTKVLPDKLSQNYPLPLNQLMTNKQNYRNKMYKKPSNTGI
jgi:hypothetical protein